MMRRIMLQLAKIVLVHCQDSTTKDFAWCLWSSTSSIALGEGIPKVLRALSPTANCQCGFVDVFPSDLDRFSTLLFM